MERFERYSVLLRLVREMNEADSWSGETHIQKSAYFLQEGLDAGLGYRFILYRHGPFSFELRSDLIAMRADEFLAIQVRHPGYGPAYVAGKRALLLEASSEATKGLGRRIRFAAQHIGPRSVADLERVATALYVRKEHPDASAEALARYVHEIKPHVPVPQAAEAVIELERLMKDAADL